MLRLLLVQPTDLRESDEWLTASCWRCLCLPPGSSPCLLPCCPTKWQRPLQGQPGWSGLWGWSVWRRPDCGSAVPVLGGKHPQTERGTSWHESVTGWKKEKRHLSVKVKLCTVSWKRPTDTGESQTFWWWDETHHTGLQKRRSGATMEHIETRIWRDYRRTRRAVMYEELYLGHTYFRKSHSFLISKDFSSGESSSQEQLGTNSSGSFLTSHFLNSMSCGYFIQMKWNIVTILVTRWPHQWTWVVCCVGFVIANWRSFSAWHDSFFWEKSCEYSRSMLHCW